MAAAQGPSDVGALMSQIAQRVSGYYERAHSVICLERSTVQPIGTNWTPEGLARTVESDLRVEYRGRRRPPAARGQGHPGHPTNQRPGAAGTRPEGSLGLHRSQPAVVRASLVPAPCTSG